MTPKRAIEEGLGRQMVDGDGEEYAIEAKPGLSESEIDALEAELPGELPQEVRELLAYASGLEPGAGPVDVVDFRGGTGGFEYEPAFPCGLSVAGDGTGNFWVVDIDPETGAWGPVFYACHDPPVIVVQASSLGSFLQDMFECESVDRSPDHPSDLSRVYGEAAMEIWRRDPFLLPCDDPRVVQDPELRSFAERLGPGFRIADFRDAHVGHGFSWGRHGPDTKVRRKGQQLIFGVEDRRLLPRLKRLFGGGGS